MRGAMHEQDNHLIETFFLKSGDMEMQTPGIVPPLPGGRIVSIDQPVGPRDRGQLGMPGGYAMLLAAMTSTAQAAGADTQVGASSSDTLPTVTVTGRGETAHGPTEDYVANRGTTATKTDTPIMETPQSISVVTGQQMQDQGAQTLQDALRYSAGVRSDAYGLDSRGDWSFIRGVEPTQYQDGMRVFFDFFSNVRPEVYAIERVEILRGPGSTLFGQGSTGGTVNVVSKRPQARPHREIDVQLGNYDRRQVGVDLTGPLTTDGDLLYRFIGVGRDSETQVDFTESDRWLLAPSLTWQPTDRTNLTLLVNIQRDTGTVTTAFPPWSGTLLPNPNGEIGTERFTSEPDFDRFDNSQDAVGWQFEHALDAMWTVRQNMRYSHSSVDYRTLYPDVFSNPQNPFVDAAQRKVFRFGYIREQQDDAWTLDNQMQADWDWGFTRHTVLVGLDYSHDRIQRRQGFSVDTNPFDLFDPVYGSFTAPVALHEPDTSIQQVGVYFQDQIRLGQKWILSGGFRHDWASTEVEGGTNAEDEALTGRVGLVHLFENGLAPFVGYSQSFTPITFTDVFNRPYEPIRGEQVEVGLRYQPPGSNSLYTAALYDITEQNRLSPDPNNPFNDIQLGEANIWGIELDAHANITRSIDLIANYAYTHARTSDGVNSDRYIAEVPAHVASGWLRYSFDAGALRGLSVGGGLRYVGESHDEPGLLDIPSVTLLDAMVAYETGRWRVALNGTNITDETYIASCLSRGDCWYGSRATVVGSVTYSF
ncbi:MAG: Ferrichrome outer membrane transporter/phage receptor [Gammaproteobacteria bacterium]|nr:Ferrichrome outer membrane transporter/phage receptor [Gammaproteobacteria bacterium]